MPYRLIAISNNLWNSLPLCRVHFVLSVCSGGILLLAPILLPSSLVDDCNNNKICTRDILTTRLIDLLRFFCFFFVWAINVHFVPLTYEYVSIIILRRCRCIRQLSVDCLPLVGHWIVAEDRKLDFYLLRFALT